MTNEKKILFSDYVENLAAARTTTMVNRIRYVSMFLETDFPLSRKGLKEYMEKNVEVPISGYPNAARNAIVDFLQFIGKSGRKTRKIKQEKSIEALEKLSVISEKNIKSIQDFMLFLENEKDYSHNTLRVYKDSLTDFFRYATDFSQDNARRYIKALEEKGYKPQTLRLRITSLEKYGVFLHKAITVKRPKYKKTLSTDNVPTEQEYYKLLDYLKSKNDIKHYYWIKLLATTGARVSEFLQFTYEDVMRGETTLKGKGGKYRRIFFQKELSKNMVQYAKENNLQGIIATSKYGTAITSRGFAQILKEWGEKAGIERCKMHPHAFRHLFAKLFLKRNKDIVELADLLGHGSIETTRIYLQKSYDEQKRDFNKNVVW